MGAINGALITVSKVPDIVVTLAMLFVWQGVALLILNAPGGAVASWLCALSTGSFPGLDWLPRAVVFLAVITALIATLGANIKRRHKEQADAALERLRDV